MCVCKSYNIEAQFVFLFGLMNFMPVDDEDAIAEDVDNEELEETRAWLANSYVRSWALYMHLI